MAKTRDPATYQDFDELMERLTSIVGSVRAKDVSIEESLDLLEEGISLGLRATDIVEAPEFTAREQAELAEAAAAGASPGEAAVEDVAEAPSPDAKAE